MFNFQRLALSVFVGLVYSALKIFARFTFNLKKINIETIFLRLSILLFIYFFIIITVHYLHYNTYY